MPNSIYTRKKCKKLIIELNIIKYGKQIRVQQNKIPSLLMESILFYTNNCRDRLSERIYWILNDIEDYPFCQECGKQFQPRFFGLKTGYCGGLFCSNSCISNNKLIQEKKKQTCLKNYAVENPAQSLEIQLKMQNTCLKKYEHRYSLQSELVKEKSKQSCLKNHGVEYPMQSKQIQEKSKHSCLERYNVEYTFQSESIREKGKQTCLERYGVENASQSKEIIDKKKQTWLRTLGVNHPWKSKKVREKAQQTNIINLGVEHPAQSIEIQEKMQSTCLKKYGVKNAMQNINIFKKSQKNSHKLKKLKLPSNKIIVYQGYENIAILKLLEDAYLEDQIITDLIPQIKYQFNNKDKVYSPDIFIPNENKIIEVKSTWTYEKDLDKNLAKRQACLNYGYQFEFWICSNKEVLEIK